MERRSIGSIALWTAVVVVTAACSSEMPTSPSGARAFHAPVASAVAPPGSAYACAQPATVTGSGTDVAYAADCNPNTNWQPGPSGTVRLDFGSSPRSLSGLHVILAACPSGTDTYSIVATKADGTGADNFSGAVAGSGVDCSVGGGAVDKNFDLGVGFRDYSAVEVTVSGPPSPPGPFPFPPSPAAQVAEIELIVPSAADADGDGVLDNVDAFVHSNLAPFVSVGSCTTTVVNHLFADGATFNDLIGAAYDGAKNHGKFVSAVAALTDGWKKADLILGSDEGAITSCAAKTK